VLEPLVYGVGLAFFAFTIVAAARMKHDMLLLACIPPVFVAMVMGFVMAIYAGQTYGIALPVGALIPGPIAAWHLPKYYASRDQLIAIYLAWAVGMVFALIGVQMPDAA
jgi:hypothetical protein